MRKQINSSINISQIQARSSLAHPHLNKLFGINNPIINKIFNKQDPNGIYFEYFPTTLNKLITSRNPTTIFLESDLIAILKSLISALAYFQTNNIFHGNLSTETVYFDENQGLFKICDEEIINGQFYSLQQTRERKKIGFIPPELIQVVRDFQIQEVRENFYKTDVWAVGLILLEAATLKKSSDIYDIKEISIIKQVIYERIYWLSQFYTPEFTHSLRLMLEFDPKLRPDFLLMNKLLNQKISSPKRKVIWPPVPIGLNNSQNSVQSDYNSAKIKNYSKQITPNSPKMLTAMPKQAIERYKQNKNQQNYEQMQQKPLEIQDNSQIYEKICDKAGIAEYYPKERISQITKMQINKLIKTEIKEQNKRKKKSKRTNSNIDRIQTPLSQKSSSSKNLDENESGQQRNPPKKSNFSETVQKIAAELSETKELISNYQQKAKIRNSELESPQKS